MRCRDSGCCLSRLLNERKGFSDKCRRVDGESTSDIANGAGLLLTSHRRSTAHFRVRTSRQGFAPEKVLCCPRGSVSAAHCQEAKEHTTPCTHGSGFNARREPHSIQGNNSWPFYPAPTRIAEALLSAGGCGGRSSSIARSEESHSFSRWVHVVDHCGAHRGGRAPCGEATTAKGSPSVTGRFTSAQISSTVGLATTFTRDARPHRRHPNSTSLCRLHLRDWPLGA